MNEVNPYNPRLRNYELELERHLRNVLLQIEEQLRKQELGQRTIRLRHKHLTIDEPQLTKELKRLKRELNETEAGALKFQENEEHDRRAHETANERLDELREELLGEIHLEKELRHNLDDLNHQIHSTQQKYDSVAWPERNDTKLMKNMVSKANSNVSNMEKDKRIQDAYIDRLRKDIEISENELEQLAITAKRLKDSQASERGEFVKLKDQLETFESGAMQLEDHYSKLMKSLQHNRNKVRLLDKRQVDVIKASASQQLLTQTTQKGAAITKRIQRLSDMREKQEARIAKRENANHHLRTMSHKQEMSAPEVERSLAEAQRMCGKLRIQCEAAEDEHESIRRERQSDFRPADVHTISDAYEQIEKDLFLVDFKLKAYKRVNEELEELVKERKASDKLAPPKSLLGLPEHNNGGMRRSKSANGQDNWGHKRNYSKIRDSITELVRKKVALEYKRKRMEEKILEKQQQFHVAQTHVDALHRSQKEVEKEHEEKIETALPIVDPTQVDEKDPEGVMEQKVAEYGSRLRNLQEDTKNLVEQLEKARSECLFYRSKIGDFEALENMSEKHANGLNEIHTLQKQHQQLEKELWQVQKELEFTVMRRDYAVNRARTVLGTHNEIRVQRQQNNDKLREEIFQLEQDIQQTMSFLSV